MLTLPGKLKAPNNPCNNSAAIGFRSGALMTGTLLLPWILSVSILSIEAEAYVCVTWLWAFKCATAFGKQNLIISVGNWDLNVIMYLTAAAFNTGNSSTFGFCNSGIMCCRQKSVKSTNWLVWVIPKNHMIIKNNDIVQLLQK